MELKAGYKQTEIGVIPEDWKIDTFSSVTPLGVKNGIVDGPFGSNLKTIHYKKSGIPIITSGYVTNGYFFADNYLFVDEEKFKQEKRSAVNPGDIVMAKIGARSGASAILPLTHPIGILSGNALKISVDSKRHSTFYIWQVLWNLYTTGKLDDLKTTGAQPAVSMASLKKYLIPLPPLVEQQAIATALSDVDALLDKLDALIAKKRDLKQAAMQQLLTAQTRLPGFSGEWECMPIAQVFNFRQGIQIPIEYQVKTQKLGFFRFIRIIDLTDPREEWRFIENSESSAVISKTDLFMVRYGVPGLVGFGFEGVIANNLFRLIPKRKISNNFFFHVLKAKAGEIYAISGSSTMPAINFSSLGVLQLDVPPIEEQTAIATILSDMDAEIITLEARRDKTHTLKQGMMQELLTGKTRLI